MLCSVRLACPRSIRPATALGRDLPGLFNRLFVFKRLFVIAFLGLRPEMPALRHVLIDDEGPALVGRLWRGFLIHDGNYSPLEPAVHGADLILRPTCTTFSKAP